MREEALLLTQTEIVIYKMNENFKMMKPERNNNCKCCNMDKHNIDEKKSNIENSNELGNKQLWKSNNGLNMGQRYHMKYP